MYVILQAIPWSLPNRRFGSEKESLAAIFDADANRLAFGPPDSGKRPKDQDCRPGDCDGH